MCVCVHALFPPRSLLSLHTHTLSLSLSRCCTFAVQDSLSEICEGAHLLLPGLELLLLLSLFCHCLLALLLWLFEGEGS